MLTPGHERLILIPYDAAERFEPAIAREHPSNGPALPIVAQTLGERIDAGPEPAPYRVGTLVSRTGRDGYTAGVRAVLELIAAGDAYQVNLAHTLSAQFTGDAWSLASDLRRSAQPEFGGVMVFDLGTERHAVISLSPELFLSYDAPSRRIVTKPMKGTRPLDTDPDELRHAEKDRAELNMIVDLMRNDLGRVAEPGTVRVTRPRDIDPHARSVWQATATVEARLSERRTPADLVRACFPPGSITGAPKVRACEIIRSLEPTLRGPYCGSLLRLRPDGSFDASVLIRTAHITGTPDSDNPHGFLDAELCFPVGAGIVADSDPMNEWEETLTKASSLLSAVGQRIG